MVEFSKYGHYYQLGQVNPELLDGCLSYTSSILAKVTDMANKAIVSAIIETAKECGVTDLFLIDKKFIIEAITEKMERLKGEKNDDT